MRTDGKLLLTVTAGDACLEIKEHFNEKVMQVMRRLEELEVREALEEQWREEETEEEESDDEEEESDDETGDEEEEVVGEMHRLSGGGDRYSEKNRKVSWAFDEGEDPSLPSVNPMLEIRFSHSEQLSVKGTVVGEQLPEQPSDLAHFTCQAPKPILKTSQTPILVKEVEDQGVEEDDDDDEIPEPFDDPCRTIVLEKADVVEDKTKDDSELDEIDEVELPKRVSKFKAMRAARK